MRNILRIILLLPLALPVTIVLVHWPLWFAVVGGGACVLALCIMPVVIVTSAPRYQPVDRRAAATVDNVPVRELTVQR